MSEGITVDVSEFCKGLEKDVQQMAAGMDRTIRQIGVFMQDQAAGRSPPPITGGLRRSITHQESVQNGVYVTEVGTAQEYAPYVEFGTGDRGSASGGYAYKGHMSDVSYTAGWKGMKAEPYLRPALFDLEDMYVGMVKDTLGKAIR